VARIQASMKLYDEAVKSYDLILQHDPLTPLPFVKKLARKHGRKTPKRLLQHTGN
jgi:hypothetical protein